MSDSNFTELIVYFFSLVAVVFLASSSGTKLRVSRKKSVYSKKIAWAVVVISSMYWVLTVPYTSWYHDYYKKLDYPNKVSSIEEQSKYIDNHQGRIENLEKEVEETKETLRAVREHYQFILQIFMYAIIFYGCNQIFNSKDKDLEEIQSDQISKL